MFIFSQVKFRFRQILNCAKRIEWCLHAVQRQIIKCVLFSSVLQ